MKTWLGGLVVSMLGATAVACGATADVSATTANADTTPATDPDFEVFTTRADAETFIAAHKDDLFGDTPMLADTDPTTLRVQGLLDKHWPAVIAKYHPGFPEPFVFVLDNDVLNAQAMFDWHVDKALNIILVDGALAKLSDDDVAATLLHESGHLTTKNGIGRYADALAKYYQAGPCEGVGIAATDDPKLRAILPDFIARAFNGGGVDIPELDGLFAEYSLLGYFFDTYDQKHTDPTNPDCATLATELQTVQGILLQAAPAFGDKYTFTDAALTALATHAPAAEAAALTCLKPPANVDLEAAVDEVFQGSPGELADTVGDDEVPLWTGKDALTGMFALSRDLHAQQRAISGAPNYTQLRDYTNEEQADDFALTVMASEGTDLGQMRTLFLDLVTDPSDLALCNGILASGAVPPYSLVEPHHGSCYRAYHVAAFKAYLDAGGVGVVIPNIPLPPTATDAHRTPSLGRKPWQNSTTLL